MQLVRKYITIISLHDCTLTQHRFNENIYGTHPFYMEIRDGKAHGALFLNAHGQDVFLHNDRITWKVIGGILEYYFIVPEDNMPNSVIRAYTDLVGKPMMIGMYICRCIMPSLLYTNAFMISTLDAWMAALSMGISRH